MKPKLLAPVGNFVALKVALDSGADEVYFGVKGLNMRAGAQNFVISDIKKIINLCHQNNCRAFLAINTIVYDNEIKKVELILKKAKKYGIDAIIAWDMSVINIALKLGLEIHLSTQASVSNFESISFYKNFIPNLKRVVLARECTLSQIKNIIQKIRKNKLDIEIEVFIHGAMCVSISGRCFMSQELFGKSANRGECIQPCRREYEAFLKDPEEGKELSLGKDYVMSPKDLCAMPFIEKLIDSGITCFKVEGRNRNPEYVNNVISSYRKIIDYYVLNKNKISTSKNANIIFQKMKKELVSNMINVYNKGFSDGFFLGKPVNEWSKEYGSKGKEYKLFVGKVVNYYPKKKVAEVKIDSYSPENNKDIIILGKTTGLIRQKIRNIKGEINKGGIITFIVNSKVRKNDDVYKIMTR